MIRKPVPASSCIRNSPVFEYILGPVFSVVEDKLHLIEVDSVTKKEILNIRNLIKSLENLNFDNFNLDFTELVEKKYHEGLKFTFFAKNVRGKNNNFYPLLTTISLFCLRSQFSAQIE